MSPQLCGFRSPEPNWRIQTRRVRMRILIQKSEASKRRGAAKPGRERELGKELLRLRNEWNWYRSCRERRAVYGFLDSVYRFSRTVPEPRREKRIGRAFPANPILRMIRRAAGGQVDMRTASKWSRVIRRALREKTAEESLEAFVLKRGGINACAATARGQRLKRKQPLVCYQ
jgi:hypothetical protein